MSIILWIGNGSNQKALAHKINLKFKIDQIFVESKQNNQNKTIKHLFNFITDKLFFYKLHTAWIKLLSYYNNQFNDYPNVPIFHVNNINSDVVYDATLKLSPHLIVVSGTSLIQQKLLSIKPQFGIINLHTGLSPYVKGGPNCTNWCLATQQFHLIGNTVMWIDKGIDSGNIICTELTRFTGEESLNEIHLKVMEHAHDLYLHSIDHILKKKSSNVPQSQISNGKTYYTKNWNFLMKWKALTHFKKFKIIVQSDEYKANQQKIKTVDF